MSGRRLPFDARPAPATPSSVAAEEMRYLGLYLRMKAAALCLGTLFIALGLASRELMPENLAIFGQLLAITLIQMLATRVHSGQLAVIALGFVLELAIITVAIFQINHHIGNTFLTVGCAHFSFYYLMVTQAAILFRRRLVALSGAGAALSLFGLLVWLAWLEAGLPEHRASGGRLVLLPETFDHHQGFRTFILAHMLSVAIEAGALLVLVHIGKRLLVAWTAAERARTNLARYFSPQMIEGLMRQDSPTGADRRQNVAVLFVDMRNFTGMAEGMEPEEVLDLLREFHRRCEAEIFRCNGFMEKFVGDALLVAFGVPDPSGNDARKALDCALGILMSVAAWNLDRRRAGLAPIQIGIGLHHGPAVLGDIGSQRSVTFAVIGDTVNVASRLQELTKHLATPLAASAEFVTQWAAESGVAPDRQHHLHRAGTFEIEGRRKRVEAWVYSPRPPDVAADPPGRHTPLFAG